ncbi:flavodoxin domain-containing protein [Planomicrobium sp. CPCC 101079]|uniref:flavodoxin domain-containing protein n=1 Tax=Planomicrobium sp. CPCC 101079 TaxID=2599618 RepID=UPI0011B42729|nr:flavodoxin domain-containing protein [Planomicrobium sp. CPCC 101079]TWT13252.1 flavodoxin [Planomicrobium sp. CPCC 101079]
MASTNCKKKLAIVYASVTGNTEAVAHILEESAKSAAADTTVWRVEDFPLAELSRYDAVLIGTYTWGSGEIPKEMRDLFEAFENLQRKELVTAVFGTGDSFFAEFCGAVNRFRDMLYVHTSLAATLKIELMPQDEDRGKCEKFVSLVLRKTEDKVVTN